MTRPPTVAEVRDQKLMAPAREQKLPTWAQETIQALRAKLAVAEIENNRLRDRVETLEEGIADAATANTGPEDSTAWLWRETGGSGEELPALGLGNEAMVEFRPAPGIEITVYASGNGVIAQSLLHLMVIPVERGRFLIQPVSAKIKP
jgi:hypothetical protein